MPLDSIAAAAQVFDAAQRRGDWFEALRWQQRIAAALPRMPLALRQLAETEHNFGNAVPEPGGGSRYLIRNSLERARIMMHAIALLDSSIAVADQPVDVVGGLYWKARILERYGLPLEALAGYERALGIAPQEPTLLAARDSLLLALGAPAPR
jgi:tetratricopeptide (TPR) repeat protein